MAKKVQAETPKSHKQKKQQPVEEVVEKEEAVMIEQDVADEQERVEEEVEEEEKKGRITKKKKKQKNTMQEESEMEEGKKQKNARKRKEAVEEDQEDEEEQEQELEKEDETSKKKAKRAKMANGSAPPSKDKKKKYQLEEENEEEEDSKKTKNKKKQKESSGKKKIDPMEEDQHADENEKDEETSDEKIESAADVGGGSVIPNVVNPILKKSFKLSRKWENIYTGGTVAISNDENLLLTTCSDDICIIEATTGATKKILKGDSEPVLTFVISKDGKQVVSASRSLVVRSWDLETGEVVRNWKAHDVPVMSMCLDSEDKLLGSGGSDGSLRVWDHIKGFCTHNFRGHERAITSIVFHQVPSKNQWYIISASEDTTIRVWDLISRECVKVITSHASVVTKLTITECGRYLVSSGRDQVVNIIDLANNFATFKTFPILETLESVAIIPVNKPNATTITSKKKKFSNEDTSMNYTIMTAGDKGMIRVWDFRTGQCLREEKRDLPQVQPYTDALYCEKSNTIVTISVDQNISFLDAFSLERQRQIIGSHDDVIDLRFVGENDSKLAVACTSENLRIYTLNNFDCQILFGHSDIIICIDAHPSGDILVTGSKDRTARIWKLMNGIFVCVGVCVGHTESIGGIALSKKSKDFLVTGSEDRTMKIWNIKKLVGDVATYDPRVPVPQASSLITLKAHSKDINAVSVSPNDKLIATASQDRTAKIWDSTTGNQLGELKGHKRGVWSVCFSNIDKVVATSSGDKTIKIWSINDYSCLKTFEGHTNSVLKVSFISLGMQLLTSGSDGLIKVWNIKSNDCVATLDEHEDKVWALAVSDDGKRIASGGADSIVCEWLDNTAEEEQLERNKHDEFLLKEQDLMNFLHQKQYLKAVKLCIELDQPRRLLGILTEISETSGGVLTNNNFIEIVRGLSQDQMSSLLKYIRQWNTNAKTMRVAQTVLHIILRSFTPSYILGIPDAKSVIEALIPYTERHVSRTEDLIIQSNIVHYAARRMEAYDAATSNAELEPVSTSS